MTPSHTYRVTVQRTNKLTYSGLYKGQIQAMGRNGKQKNYHVFWRFDKEKPQYESKILKWTEIPNPEEQVA